VLSIPMVKPSTINPRRFIRGKRIVRIPTLRPQRHSSRPSARLGEERHSVETCGEHHDVELEV
jgi:hypothetical protein